MIAQEQIKVTQTLLEKNKEHYSWKEKLCHWFAFKVWKDEIYDLIQDFQSQGVADGYAIGYQDAQKNFKTGQINLYEQGKKDGKREYLFELKSIDPDKIFSYTEAGKIFLGGNEITEDHVKVLKEEIAWWKNSQLSDIFTNSVGKQAQDNIFKFSQNFDEVKTGKLMLHNLGILEKIVDKIDSFKI